MKHASAVLLLLLAVGCLNAAQETRLQESGTVPPKLKSFLETSQELRNYSKLGYTSNFTGALRPIPPQLQSQLTKEFPQYTFHIAKMSVLIDPPADTYDLIVVTHTNTEEVQSFFWAQYWMLPWSKSWGHLLAGHRATTKDDAINKLTSLAKLIAFTATASVGPTTTQKKKLKVELLKDTKPFGFLELEIDRKLRLGRLTITAPDGKRLRHFA